MSDAMTVVVLVVLIPVLFAAVGLGIGLAVAGMSAVVSYAERKGWM